MVLTLCDGFFKTCNFLCHDAEAMYLRDKRWVIEALEHSVRLLPPLRLHLEELQGLAFIYGLAVIVEDGCGVQRCGVHLFAVVTQPDDEGVWVHDDLHVFCLLGHTVRARDGEVHVVIPIISHEPRRDGQTGGGVATLVQRVACRGGGVWGFSGVLSVFHRTHENVLIWVKFMRAHAA